jgi:hypothetical protein
MRYIKAMRCLVQPQATRLRMDCVRKNLLLFAQSEVECDTPADLLVTAA